MKAIRVHETGGPEKLAYEDVGVPEPGPEQALIKVQAIGVNFIDVYHRTGLYKISLPFTPGMEAAGVIESTGANARGFKPGDRVAYAMNLGAYGEYTTANARHLVRIPEQIDFPTAAAVMLQGLTAHYLTHSTFPLREQQTALIHAAAGGVGLLLIQLARMRGARTIGTVSSEEKEARVQQAGADHVVRYDRTDFAEEVKQITGGSGVDVVYDSVGRTTFDRSLACLKPRGMLVLFGQSSGPVPPVDLNTLNAKGSLFVTRPGLAHYIATPEELNRRAGDLFQWLGSGKLTPLIDRTFPLRDAADAHRAIEGRRTMGKVLLIP
jgi:NADPH2:quinone reductase